MVLAGRLQTNILTFVIIFSYVSGISYASRLKGNLQVFFPNEISIISLASVGTFCVARPNADPTALQAGIDWACGQGLANCGPIQPGQPCFVADKIVAIASYAYDAYFQANQATGGTCSFNNTAMLTNTDPSSGSCIFPGSTGSGGSGGGTNSTGGFGNPPSSSFTPSGGSSFVPPGTFQPTNVDSGASGMQIIKLVYLSQLLFLSLVIL